MGPVTAGVLGSTIVIAFLISALTCACWIRFAVARNIADQPGQRRMHQRVTPRGGGVGIALALFVVIAWLLQAAPAFEFELGSLLSGLVVAAVAGLLDDFRRIGTAGKFLLQSLAAILIAGPWLLLGWPAVIVGIAAAFAVLVLINFWNFMDGANGMAATQAALVALTLALTAQQPVARLLALALMASSAGFLPFNLPKARLFMGDVGSHVIGACLAALIVWELDEHDISLFQAFILVSAFIMDAGLTLARRIMRGRRFWQAHREHLYQMAIRKGLSHSQVCAAYAAWTGVAGLTVLATAAQPMSVQAGFAGVFAAIACLIHVGLRKRWLARPAASRARS
jgi:UDP-N-acetylmuramyl pentapeptide phosphotransferase/UDP-N-acetylglucosamine-1-phosphate transferase